MRGSQAVACEQHLILHCAVCLLSYCKRAAGKRLRSLISKEEELVFPAIRVICVVLFTRVHGVSLATADWFSF